MVLADLTGLFTFSWDDLMALDLSQPASWLMVGVIAIFAKLGIEFGKVLLILDDKLIEFLERNL
ncbi:hypothetical protein [Paraburkholderia aromaticivorans]|uniref:hypothetical protein n=1 Tax=Paraburkholderia aromaticivorans TaxID=2026199 RepID=UPI00145607C7|nr:hypothetical protein [Paraburkholderia aromaticivorans]